MRLIGKRVLSTFLTIAMLIGLSPLVSIDAFAATTVLESDAKENLNQEAGIVLTKKAEAMSDGTAKVTLTAHTTGDVKQTTAVAKPTDIVLVLDMSGSMDTADVILNATYTEELGKSYTARVSGKSRTCYGFNDSATYYINTGTDEAPVYEELTKVGRDGSYYEYFKYTASGTEVYVYPKLSSGLAENHAENYAVVQFYSKSGTATTRTEALKSAVNSFVDTTLSMNQSSEEDNLHRISIVKFAGEKYSNNTTNNPTTAEGNGTYTDSGNKFNYSQVVKGLTNVDAAGAASLKNAVAALEPAGSTAVDKGLNLAEKILDEQADDSRDQIVIVFTDGEPNYFSGFDEAVANSAITTAKSLKDNGITVYGVSVAPNADAEDISENINKFMHYISSNAPGAESMNSATSVCDMSAGYYMTPRADITLEMIFETILQNIDNPTITLGTKALMIDTLSSYFNFENGTATEVELNTSAKNADGTWGAPVSDANLSYEINGDKVTVSGFDFDANFISETGRGEDGDFYGKRLEVSFTIVPDYTAIDGDPSILVSGKVPTNSGNATIVNSDNSVAAEVESPILSLNKVTYKVDGAEYSAYRRFAGSSVTVDTEPTKAGYTFSGWSYPDSISVSANEFTMPKADVEIVGTFTIDAVNYTVEHYKENTDGTYPTLPTETESFEAEVGDTVTATAKSYDGYCFNSQNSNTIAVIESIEDNIVLKLYYDIDSNADSVPDKYQKKVIFKIANGTWSDGTSDDIAVILDLKTDGKWDINGSADYAIPVGMIANTGYKNGAWEIVPPATFSGTHTETFSYDFDRSTTEIIPSDTVNYIVEHYVADAEGNYPATATDSEFLGGTIGATVVGTPKNYVGYCYNEQISFASATLKQIATPDDIVVLKLYYDADSNADSVPDKYQKKVIFKIANGTWSDGTSDDIAVILDLKTDGKWDVNGTADFATPTGMLANAGYKNGAWEIVPPATFSGTHTETFSYDFDRSTTEIIPGDIVNYIVEHYVADENGEYPTDPTDSEFLGGTIGATVVGTPKNYAGYCYNEQVSKNSATLVKITTPDDIVVLKLYYDADSNADSVPDKYQKKVIFKIVNGTWSDGTSDDIRVILDLKTDGKWDINGTAELATPVGMIANTGYKNGAWEIVPPVTFSGTHTEIFSYDFDRSTTPIVPGTVVNYIVEHYVADTEGNYPTTATDSEFLGGTIGATVVGTPKNYAGYCYNEQVSKNYATLVKITTSADIVTLKLYYDIDSNADSVPDKYQKKVIFKIANGTWSDGTSDDIAVVLDLKTDGKWDVNGSADYATPVGMIANTGYKNGAWDVEPKVTYTGTHTEIFSYDFDRSTTEIIPGDTVNYIVEHYVADENGEYPTDPTDSEFLGGTIGATVVGTPKNYAGYCYNEQTSKNSATLVKITTSADIVTLKLYYDIDSNADSVPDKYQKKVIFKIANGTWSDGTSDDIAVILDLKTAGKWDINGTADYATPVGMLANAGYKNGAWDATPSVTYRGTHTEIFSYDFDRSTTEIIPGDTVNYIVEHYVADAEGNYPTTATDSEFLGGTIGATVVGTPKNYNGYCYNAQVSKKSATLVKITTSADIVVLKLYYDADSNADSVPDKYQKKVIFKIANGTWSDGTSDDIGVILDLKTDGKWDVNGTATLTAPTGMIPNAGYFAGAWDGGIPETVSGTHTETFVYGFAKQPSAGGVPTGSNKPNKEEEKEPEEETPVVIPGKVILTKVDSSNKDKVLPNVVFDLYDSNENLIGQLATDKNGQITVDNLAPGDYYFKEVQPTGGYILNDKIFDFTITEECVVEIVVEGERNEVPMVFTDDHFAYIVGYPDGNVRPRAYITRAEVATIFFRLLNDQTRQKYYTSTNSFSDVSNGMWFNNAVSTMEAMGVITGYPDGNFRPNQPITRAEFAAIAQRFDEKNINADVYFSDIADHWAKQYINNAGYNGWVTGYPDGTFHPDSYITRAETMTMVNRVLQRLPSTDDDLHEDMIQWPDNQDHNEWFYIPVQEATNGHDYEGTNKWTDLRENPDWTIYEK